MYSYTLPWTQEEDEAGSRVGQSAHQRSVLNGSGSYQKPEPVSKNENWPLVRIFKEFALGSENNSTGSLKILLRKNSIIGESIYHPQGDALEEKNSLGYISSTSVLFLLALLFFFNLSY